MRICLIDPMGITKGLNVGLGYLASSLIREGHEVKVIDLNNNPKNIKERLNSAEYYDLVGVSIKSFTIQSAQEISQILRRRDLICGGPHITLDGHNFLGGNPNFSIALIGEGEKALVKLANSIENNSGWHHIKGILYREGNEIIANPGAEFVDDLNSLPYPNYEVFDSVDGTIKKYPLITSRGCPYLCIYCSVGKISGKKWRFREPEDIVKELEIAKSKYNSKSFSILDDNFTQSINRAKEFCQLLVAHSINMDWFCSNGLRADRLDEELVALMKDAGCKSISLGIESLDDVVFENIKKGEKLEQVKHAINILKKYKIKVSGSFMIGLPGDSLEKTKSSIELAKKLKLDAATWGLLVPYPGTEVWQWVNQNAEIIRDWKQGFHFGSKLNSVFETEDFSEEEKVYAFKLANIKCKSYPLLFDEQKPFLFNAFNTLKLILANDIKNFPSHILYALKNIRRIWGRVAEESPL